MINLINAEHKFENLVSATKSNNPLENLIRKENDNNWITIGTTVKNEIITAHIPTEFFIKIAPPTNTSNPSLTNPPTIGNDEDKRYLVALIEIPS